MIQRADGAGSLAGPARTDRAATGPTPARQKRRFNPLFAAAAIGLFLSTASFMIGHSWDWKAEQTELDALADGRRAIMQEGLTDVEQTMKVLPAYFAASTEVVTRSQFRIFSTGLFGMDWGQIAWVPRIRRDERPAHELAAADSGLTGYRIIEKGPDDKPAAAAERDEYFPVLYVAGNLAMPEMLGFDVGSDKVQLDAMERAGDGDRLATSSLFEIPTDAGAVPGVAVFAPIYKPGSSHRTAEDRRRNPVGFARGVFAVSSILESILHGVKSPRGIDVQFFQAGATATDLPFHVRSSLLRTVPAQPRPLGDLESGLHSSGELTLGTARWKFVVAPIALAPLLVGHSRAFIVLIAGLIATSLVVAYLNVLMRQRGQLETAMDGLSAANKRLESEFMQRRSLEQQLSLANTVLSSAMESSFEEILVVDNDARIISHNQRFKDMWNIPAELAKAADQPVLDAVAAQTKESDAFVTRVQYLYAHPNEMSSDRIELKNGQVFERNTRSLYDGRRNYLGRIWFFRDITEQEAVGEAVRKSEEKFRNLVETTTDYIWEIDENNRYTYVSPAAKALLGYEPGELIGRSVFELMPPSEAQRLEVEFAKIAAARRPFSMLENTVLRRDGTEIVLESSGVPVFDKNRAFKGYRGIDHNVTERKRLAVATQYRGTLLHALAAAATELLTTSSLEEGVPAALRMVGEAVGADRVLVLEAPHAPEETAPLCLRHVWHSPGAPVRLDPVSFSSIAASGIGGDPWFAPLAEGKPVTGLRGNVSGAIRELFDSQQIKSILVLPILMDGKFWGQIAFNDCRTERAWATVEIDILRTLSDLVGTSITKARYVQELTDANMIVQSTPTILFRLRGEPELPLIYVSQNIRLFGLEPAELVATPLLYKALIHPEDVTKVNDAMADAMNPGSGQSLIEYRSRNGYGDYRWVEVRYAPIRDANRRLVEIEGVLIDITERKQAEQKIALLARTDSLTGLANRATFIDRLRQAFAASRRGASAFAVLYLDVDRFKDINDTLGHPAGDVLLRTVADRLRTDSRESDVVARLGGDEFAVLQADVTDSSDAGGLAAKIRRALARPCRLGGSEVHITASIGISIYSSDISGPDDMLAQADMALYRAKEEGRDQYRFHSEEIDHEVRERVAIADELRLALDRNELELYYQPQVEIASCQIVGMEALIRWNHPTRGLLKPGAFIPIAEKTGTIIAIGQWVLEHACAQMSQWQKEGIAPQSIAVNVSLAQLKRAKQFIQGVTDTLARSNLAPGDLEIDVTESIMAHATLAQSDVFEKLQKLGIKIAIDDFGTQYSSLDYLRTYRVNRLKIPHGMIEAARPDTGNAAMVRAIIGIARELKVDIVAQGVETEAQWSFLTETAPAAKVQGYYYSKPVPADRAAALLQRKQIGPAPEQSGVSSRARSPDHDRDARAPHSRNRPPRKFAS